MRRGLLADRRHGVTDDRVMYSGLSLHVGCHNLSMFAKIALEGVALPTAFGFDDVKGHAS